MGYPLIINEMPICMHNLWAINNLSILWREIQKRARNSKKGAKFEKGREIQKEPRNSKRGARFKKWNSKRGARFKKKRKSKKGARFKKRREIQKASSPSLRDLRTFAHSQLPERSSAISIGARATYSNRGPRDTSNLPRREQWTRVIQTGLSKPRPFPVYRWSVIKFLRPIR